MAIHNRRDLSVLCQRGLRPWRRRESARGVADLGSEQCGSNAGLRTDAAIRFGARWRLHVRRAAKLMSSRPRCWHSARMLGPREAHQLVHALVARAHQLQHLRAHLGERLLDAVQVGDRLLDVLVTEDAAIRD